MSLEWGKTEYGNPFVGAAGVWPELRRRNLLKLVEREKGRKKEAGKKRESVNRFPYIYILPKITKPTL